MGLLSRRLLGALLLGAGACTTGVSVDLSVVDGPRLLAVAASPAEVEAGGEVELTALLVDASGPRADDALAWSLCTARRPLAETGPVATACLEGASGAVDEIDVAPSVTATLPEDACRLFGPDPPPAEPGEPQGRPVEPDRTGGYYQPVVVDADGEQAVLAVRLDCGVAGATQAQAAELRRRHRANVPPRVESLVQGRGDDARVLEDGAVLRVSAGETIDLRVRWSDCAQTPSCGDGACTLDEDVETCPDECELGAGCGGAEWYARFDPIALAPVDTREAIGVAWYATGGEFDVARTGRAADDPARSSENAWTAPDEAGRVTIWIVLRDDRGAASWRTLVVDVED